MVINRNKIYNNNNVINLILNSQNQTVILMVNKNKFLQICNWIEFIGYFLRIPIVIFYLNCVHTFFFKINCPLYTYLV